jgi:hypothetical protein
MQSKSLNILYFIKQQQQPIIDHTLTNKQTKYDK